MFRRDFIKAAALASGGLGLAGVLPPSILKAMSIDPIAGTTFMDAEHVVILMQENRSFDHCYGSLQGVRGFNDPRAITLPNQNPVWLQTNHEGETYVPFRLNIHDSNATWMSSLPHSWPDQVDANNNGRFDRWLDVKRSGHPPFAKMPLTLGYYTREDVPFYYSLADAFTVCDQHFCSSLTGTTPNRLYLWTGTIREAANEEVHARVMNENADYENEVGWSTFPERLEANNVSWKIYQNEISVGVGLTGEADAWLTNFGDNPIEYFRQFRVRFSPEYIANIPTQIRHVEVEIATLQRDPTPPEKTAAKIRSLQTHLAKVQEEQKIYTRENYEKLSKLEKAIHEKAFTTNRNDPDYHRLAPLRYTSNGETREVNIPKGDVLHQFREDVNTGRLPTVSWLVAPENLSDHPSAPWYGAAYVSEAMDILTSNPEVWKKTIFILTYDENDGYFDHVPPFTAPDFHDRSTGLVSDGIDTRVDFVKKDQDIRWRPERQARENSIGLGFRVPLVVASPWSRGGVVNSQVFDHTSVLQFLEKFLSGKTGTKIEETNISTWRRTVCGDLTSVFKPYNGEKMKLPVYVKKEPFFEGIYDAKFRKEPVIPQALSKAEISNVVTSAILPRQEPGTRVSSALPYQLYADGGLAADRKSFAITMQASDEFFQAKASGSPFSIYAPGSFWFEKVKAFEPVRKWAYAVKAGAKLTDTWPLAHFENRNYHLRVYGPNGFFREFMGNAKDHNVEVICGYETADGTPTGNLKMRIVNHEAIGISFVIEPGLDRRELKPKSELELVIDLSKQQHWYDVTFQFFPAADGAVKTTKRYAGRVETGRQGITDPMMGAGSKLNDFKLK